MKTLPLYARLRITTWMISVIVKEKLNTMLQNSTKQSRFGQAFLNSVEFHYHPETRFDYFRRDSEKNIFSVNYKHDNIVMFWIACKLGRIVGSVMKIIA